MQVQKAPPPQPIGQGLITEIKSDTNVLVFERVTTSAMPSEEISLGDNLGGECHAKGIVNLYGEGFDLKIFSVACLSCPDSIPQGGECHACHPEGAAPKQI